jgi:hypothetical protein
MISIYKSKTPWTEQDDDFLRNFYVQLSHTELAERLNRKIGEIKARIRNLELTLTPEQKKLKKQAAAIKMRQKLCRSLSDTQIEYLKANYANRSNKELSTMLNCPVSTVAHKGMEYGLKKSEKYIQNLTSRAGKSNKRRPSTLLSDYYILVNVLRVPKSPANRILYYMDILYHRERILKQRESLNQ